MTWATTKSTGLGVVRFRLMIEGWPDEWVTDPTITHATNADGRNVYAGLSYSGLAIHDRCLMAEAKIQADGITFKVVPTNSDDRPLASFSTYPEPIAQLAASLTESATTLTSTLVGSTTLSNNTHYYLGSETIRVATWPNIGRTKWDSQSQQHNVVSYDETRPVYVYDYPPTMEGRRAFLYAYGAGDDVAGDGTCIWRGIVNRPPRLDRDGVTWMIETQSVVSLLRQKIAGQIQEAHPIGIYHNGSSAFMVQLFYDGTTYDTFHYTGLDTEATLVDHVNDVLEDARADAGITEIDSIKLEKSSDTGWRIRIKANDDVPDFNIQVGSPLLGTAEGYTHFIDAKGRRWAGVGVPGSFGDGYPFRLEAREYVVDLEPENTQYVMLTGVAPGYQQVLSPLGPAAVTMQPNLYGGNALVSLFQDVDADPTGANPWRIYVDSDLTGAEAVFITGTLNPTGVFDVIDAGQSADVYYVDVEPYYGPGTLPGQTPEQFNQAAAARMGFDGYLTGETTITAIRSYGTGSVATFVASLKTHSIYANDGDTPQITDDDLTTWAVGDQASTPEQLLRVYKFGKAIDLETVLAEECKFVTSFPRIASDGRIDLVPLPSHTDAYVTDDAHTLDSSGILTPAGNVGSFPGWEPQRDGLINVVEIKDVYSANDDDWLDKAILFQDANSIATHKGRGKVSSKINPYSAPLLSFGIIGALKNATFESIAAQYLSTFSEDYAVISLDVSFKHFDVLCGDVVSINSALIPAGDGTRGMTGRCGVVIERRWNLDPARGQHGTLTILVNLRPKAGYSPAAVITSKSDLGGNLWSITADPANAFNVLLSTTGNGQVIEHFRDGEYVRVVQIDSLIPTVVNGVVSGTPDPVSGLISVQFGGTWTPGTSGWYLKYQIDFGSQSTEHQRQFVYNADSDLHLIDNSFARRLG